MTQCVLSYCVEFSAIYSLVITTINSIQDTASELNLYFNPTPPLNSLRRVIILH